MGRSLGERNDMTLAAADKPHLVVGNVSKRFHFTTVLDRIDLTVGRGELVTLYTDDICKLAVAYPEVDLSLWPNFRHLA